MHDPWKKDTRNRITVYGQAYRWHCEETNVFVQNVLSGESITFDVSDCVDLLEGDISDFIDAEYVEELIMDKHDRDRGNV